ncbi:BppU family phage baseplate upper protein [Enterococcus gilvus]|uniref:BppU family phage baseplate upper protein n=2 Tax=Enterococcus gilvus TaxID=160453 RepID=UPI001FCC3A6B|nr:BppU family phage baseplate upper protein [Enterococcus gilvus]
MIQAEATTPIPTGVVFWSHDKGTAKLIIQLKKGHINQTLSQGTIVPILLEFNSDTAAKGKGRHIYHAVIENALEGIVSIVLEDNILGYVGRVDGSVYIELPDSRSLDTAGRFTFDIKRSPIDEDVPELEDYYWQGFSEINKEFVDMKKKLDKAIIDFGDEKNDIVQEFHRKFTEVNTALTDALTEFEKGNFYPKPEADELFFGDADLATEEEAETGDSDQKLMTPLRVFQAIVKWTKDKFVSMTENETVLGIKNFANGLQVGGRNVLSQKGEIVFDHTSETDSSIQSGIVRFKRYGDWILVNFNFQCRSTNIASGGNLIDVLEADIIPSGSIQVDITYDKALTIDASGKVTALWGLNTNSYYAGSAVYFAKNKL